MYFLGKNKKKFNLLKSMTISVFFKNIIFFNKLKKKVYYTRHYAGHRSEFFAKLRVRKCKKEKNWKWWYEKLKNWNGHEMTCY